MNGAVRDQVSLLSAVLSGITLLLVFGAVLQVIPPTWLPHPGDAILELIPHVNAAISVFAIGTITAGWLAIKRDAIRPHRRLMKVSVGLFAMFLGLYLYKVALLGPAPFPGPRAVYTSVYLPLLGIHILLAILCIPLLSYVLLVGLTHPISEIYQTRHRLVGRIAAPLWLISFILGLVVYLLLYWRY